MSSRSPCEISTDLFESRLRGRLFGGDLARPFATPGEPVLQLLERASGGPQAIIRLTQSLLDADEAEGVAGMDCLPEALRRHLQRRNPRPKRIEIFIVLHSAFVPLSP